MKTPPDPLRAQMLADLRSELERTMGIMREYENAGREQVLKVLGSLQSDLTRLRMQQAEDVMALKDRTSRLEKEVAKIQKLLNGKPKDKTNGAVS